MKEHGDAMLRWGDRPAGDVTAEDRAAALTREALGPDALPVGLDDRQLMEIQERLARKSRARPPAWLRPALVAAVLSVSAATVMGYERGWLAPLRERLRFRSIGHEARPPAAHPAVSVVRAPAAPAGDPPPAAQPETAPAVVAPEAVERHTSAPAPHKLAVVDSRPTPVPAPPAAPRAESEEIRSLERALGLLRGKHDAPAALAGLDEYIARFPGGVLVREARVARIDALLMLGRADEAQQALEALPLDEHGRSTELQLIRAELRARADCRRAEADFTAVLAHVRTPALEERALYGRAACRSTSGNTAGAADDLRRYVDRFPTGAHSDWARRWLKNKP